MGQQGRNPFRLTVKGDPAAANPGPNQGELQITFEDGTPEGGSVTVPVILIKPRPPPYRAHRFSKLELAPSFRMAWNPKPSLCGTNYLSPQGANQGFGTGDPVPKRWFY